MKRHIVETRLTVGFTPVVTSLIGILAREWAASSEVLIRAAVVAMLDSFDRQARAGNADTYRILGIAGIPSDDFDPLTSSGTRRSVKLRFAVPTDIYLDASTTERLANFCIASNLSRARAIRVAVDRYLFDEVTKTELSPMQIVDTTMIDRTQQPADTAQRSETQT
ncbi:CopG family transcriptional regulator [Nocardia sp. NPDC046473]|uniref:ribbon-helix-helix domain-containing protein n=1 Tax=Nocardia sp. NPDC046473 TaxID=3155733 RepID=UPI003410ED2C